MSFLAEFGEFIWERKKFWLVPVFLLILVFGKQHPFRGTRKSQALQLTPEEVLLEQLLANPQRHRHREAAIAARRKGEIGLEQALELQKRLFVEDDGVDIAGG